MYFIDKFLNGNILFLSPDSPPTRTTQASSVFFGSQDLGRDCSFLKPLASTPGNKTQPIGEALFFNTPVILILFYQLIPLSVCLPFALGCIIKLIYGNTHHMYFYSHSHMVVWHWWHWFSRRRMELWLTMEPRLTSGPACSDARTNRRTHAQTHACVCTCVYTLINTEGRNAVMTF